MVDTQIPLNPTVAIIGAGAAGLSAARELSRQGISFVIIEAANRVGGRAYTESSSFKQPVDHGCSWITGSDRNFFKEFGMKEGFTLLDHSNASADTFEKDGVRSSPLSIERYTSAERSIEKAINDAGKAGKDIPASQVISHICNGGIYQNWEGALNFAVDMKDISTLDYYRARPSQPSHIVKEGLGYLVSRLNRNFPIKLNTTVTEINHSGQKVEVITTAGILKAKYCICTVSIGVLQAEKIKFTPPLTVQKQEAINDLQMGLLIKIPLLFDGNRLGLGENNRVEYDLAPEDIGTGCYFLAWPTGHNYLMGFIGGKFGWDLYRDGEDAVVNYAIEKLIFMVGSKARKHLIKGFASDWADNPLTLGSYSAAKPGCGRAREKLQELHSGKILFAGEAFEPEIYGLVNGAFESGKKAAILLGDLNNRQ